MRRISRVVAAVAALVAAAVVAGGAAPSAGEEAGAPPTDVNGFAAACAKLYEQTGPSVTARVVGPLEVEVRTPQGAFTAYLDGIYSFCERDRSACASYMRSQIGAAATAFAAGRTSPDLSELRVTVRPSSYVDQLAAAGGKSDPVAEPLVDDLWVIGVRDRPTTIETLGKADLDALKLTAAEALAAGKRNVEATLRGQLEAAARVETGGVALRGDDYLASLLALPDLWAPIAEKFDGELYVAVPASDVVLFADAREKGAAAAMERAAREYALHAKRPISLALFAWTPTGWEIVPPDAIEKR